MGALSHAYPDPKSGWDIYGSAFFDLTSNKLRPADWTSADAAGFPILPLLLRADEASSGSINHALRFTIESSDIRTEYTWPARHLTSNGTSSTNLPPMGQAFRIKASYTIPANFQHAVSRHLTSVEDVRASTSPTAARRCTFRVNRARPGKTTPSARFNRCPATNSKRWI